MDVTCKICFNQYDDLEHRPRTLGCGHTFCEECITNVITLNPNCPVCQNIITIKKACEATVNYALEEILQNVKSTGSSASYAEERTALNSSVRHKGNKLSYGTQASCHKQGLEEKIVGPEELEIPTQEEFLHYMKSSFVITEERAPLLPSVPPSNSDELHPIDTPSFLGVPMVTCRVCQCMIDISGKTDQHVVRCNQCNEATPIKSAPPGKKFVRCPCNCLLISKSSSQRIACPRPGCNRIINLSPSPSNPSLPDVPGMCRVTCVYCHNTFIFNTLNNALARCPHCRKVSSVGPEFARCRGIVFVILASLFLGIGFTITFTTLEYAETHPGIYAASIVAFLISALLFYRTLYYCSMKISLIEGPL